VACPDSGCGLSQIGGNLTRQQLSRFCISSVGDGAYPGTAAVARQSKPVDYGVVEAVHVIQHLTDSLGCSIGVVGSEDDTLVFRGADEVTGERNIPGDDFALATGIAAYLIARSHLHWPAGVSVPHACIGHYIAVTKADVSPLRGGGHDYETEIRGVVR